MTTKARTKPATSASKEHGGARAGAGRPRNPVAGPITEAQIEELAKQLPPGSTRKYVPLALAALIEIAKNGTMESARVSAAKAIMDFYETELGATFAPSAAATEWDQLLNS